MLDHCMSHIAHIHTLVKTAVMTEHQQMLHMHERMHPT